MIYFAYGSNLNIAQMRTRCPMAEPLLPLQLPNWQLVFRGVADIEPNTGSIVHGATWNITRRCEAALDRYEGVRSGLYLKKYFVTEIKWNDGTTTEENVLVYIMSNAWRYDMPTPAYLNAIREGYADFKLPADALHRAVKRTRQLKRKRA